MTWHIITVGKLKKGAEYDLCNMYIKNCKTPINIIEIEEKRPLTETLKKQKEAEYIEQSIPPMAKTIALDQRGTMLSSEDFANTLMGFQNEGIRDIAFIIGGAFGLDSYIIKKVNYILSFGKMTFPHKMARAMLCEQLYRAQKIFEKHPYHKM